MVEPKRNTLYWVLLDNMTERKPYLVVSNNERNRVLDSVLAVRVTTSVKPPIRSIVVLENGEPLVGRVLCDDIVEVYKDEIREPLGALSPRAIVEVNKALKFALALS